MKKQVVYDNEGYIFYQVDSTTEVRKPVGVPYLEVDVPAGKRIKSIDVSKTPHVAVFEDLPKTEQDTKIEALEKCIAEFSILVAANAAGKDAGTPSATPTPAV